KKGCRLASLGSRTAVRVRTDDNLVAEAPARVEISSLLWRAHLSDALGSNLLVLILASFEHPRAFGERCEHSRGGAAKRRNNLAKGAPGKAWRRGSDM